MERKHKYLLETARALLFQSNLPIKYWGECILTATHIINTLPSHALENKCPVEVLHQRKPSYSHMRSFGCLCYPTIPKPQRTKFDPKTSPHVFIGYPPNTKGYKVLSLATKKIHVSRDVVFHETIFPFSLTKNTTVFPTSPLFHSDIPSFSSLYPNNDSPLPNPTQNPPISSHTNLEQCDQRTHQPTSPITSSSAETTSLTQPFSEHPKTAPVLRKSTRVHTTPSYLKDYIHLKPKTTSLSLCTFFTHNSHIAPEELTPSSQSFVMNISHECEPSSYEEAAMNPAWKTAMTQEFSALHENHTWDLVPLPSGKKPIGCKWVYKIKHKADGSIERLKARLVVKGYTQHAGVDYTETFSPVVKMTTVRALLATAAKKHWNIFQLDVNNAFLHGDLLEEVYMDIPQGLDTGNPNLVCKLNKSLYGLKQASRQWYAKLTDALNSRGYTHSMNDYSLFHKKSSSSMVLVAVYVDDVIITGTDLLEIQDLKTFLHETFKIKDLGRLHYFLGLEVLYKEDGILISQRKFTLDLLKEYNCSHFTPFSSPLDPLIKLRAEEGSLLSDPAYYRKLIGKLNFLTNTRQNIVYGVQHLSQFMHAPREPHLQAAFHML